MWRQRRAAGEASAGCGRSKAPPRRERQGTPAGRRAGEARHQRGHRGEAPPPGGRRCGWLQGEAPPPGGALEGDERRRRQASVNRPHPFLTRASTSVSLPRVPPRLRRVYNHSHLPPTRQSPHARAHTYIHTYMTIARTRARAHTHTHWTGPRGGLALHCGGGGDPSSDRSRAKKTFAAWARKCEHPHFEQRAEVTGASAQQAGMFRHCLQMCEVWWLALDVSFPRFLLPEHSSPILPPFSPE